MSLKRHAFSFTSSFLPVLVLCACTKGVPKIEDMGSLSGFTLNQNQVTGKNFQLTGDCSDQWIGVELSLDGGGSWVRAETYSSDFALKCSSGGNYSGDFVFTSVLSSFLVRGVSTLGTSNTFTVTMSEPVPLHPQGIVAAGGTVSDASYKLKGTLSFDDQTSSVQGANYKIKGRLTSQ